MIEDQIQITAIQMSQYYYSKYYRPHIKHPVRESFYNNTFKPKFFKYFIKAASMFCIRENFNYSKFIDCCMMCGFKYPAQIPIENNWNDYKKSWFGLQEENEEKDLALALVSGAKTLKRYNNNVYELLLSKDIQNRLFKDTIDFDLLILYFSSTFESFYKENKDKFKNKIDFGIKRYSASQYPRIIKKIKEILKLDYFKVDDKIMSLINFYW